LRVQHSEQRASGRVIHVEVTPGTVMILPDWMVDASVCAGMALGAPHISMDALRELWSTIACAALPLGELTELVVERLLS